MIYSRIDENCKLSSNTKDVAFYYLFTVVLYISENLQFLYAIFNKKYIECLYT